MKQFSLQYISSFCMSIHLSMDAGISVSEGILLFTEEEKDSARKAQLTTVYDSMEQGETLAKALSASGAFPSYMIDMIEMGERTGKLDDTLMSLSRYYDRQEQMSGSIRGAVFYPLMLLATLLIVLIVFVVKVLPIFYDVYRQLGSEMSGIAKAALNFGMWLSNNWIPIVIVLVVIIALAVLFRKNLGRGIMQIFMRGSIGKAITSSRFSGVMAMAMSSGMEMDEAMALSERIIDDKTSKGKISKCAEMMQEGEPFAACVSETDIFAPLFSRMIAIGVKTGSTDKVMEEIAKRSGDEATDRVEAFVGKIEPTLVIVMSILVGVLLLSVMLPLAGIMTII